MKTHKVRVLSFVGLFVFTMFSTYTIANAEDAKTGATTTKKVQVCSDNDALLDKYNATLTQNENNKLYTLELNPDDSASRKVNFTIYKINGVDQGSGQTVSYGHPIKNLDLNDKFVQNASGDYTVSLEIRTTEDEKCDKEVIIELYIEKGPGDFEGQASGPEITDGDEVKDGYIDCSKSQSDAFAKAFCDVKQHAIADKHTESVPKDGNITKVLGMKCSYKNLKANDGYPNKSYYYASSEETKSYGNYEYHFEPGKTVKGAKIQCKIACEESVIVEYGPPVASKAGLCFEYKVKVTSRVNCGMETKPEKPKTYKGYCSPTPICTGRNSRGYEYVVNQGGPNEDFDKCIKKCDGGKYTKKCSNKCYKKVYGTTKKVSNKVYNDDDDEDTGYTVQRLATKTDDWFSLDACVARSEHGCYYRKNGKMHFQKKNNAGKFGKVGDSGSIARWYYDVNRFATRPDLLTDYIPDKEGIPRHILGTGNYCKDKCHWEGCDGEKYLNPDYAAKDVEYNKDLYEKAKAECKRAATCTTKTAEFTISTTYKQAGASTVKTINYPYTSGNPVNKDKLTSPGDKADSVTTKGNTNTTFLSYGGCYNKTDEKRWYLAEWSFPGTWINNKTGEISFTPKPSPGWYKETRKFCMPLDAQNANVSFWRRVISKNTKITDAQIENELKNTSNTSANGYNIKATTTNFGYFGWNFNISCFYSIFDDTIIDDCPEGECPTEDKPTCPDGKCPAVGPENYSIRSVDKENLFPGSKLTPGAQARSTERLIGWNWTANAKNTKNPNYVVDPAKLAASIQSKSKTLYGTDSEIDYSFTLKSETIKKIREYNRQNEYATWNGSTSKDRYGIFYYKSNLFRSEGTGQVIDPADINKVGTPGKNNE